MFDLRCHFTDFHIITHKQEKENEHFSLPSSKMSETEIGDYSAALLAII